MRFTSALPLKADIEMGAALRLLVTLSGHSLDYAIQNGHSENQGCRTGSNRVVFVRSVSVRVVPLAVFLLTNESPQDCREAMHLPRLKFPVTTNRGKEKPSDHTPVWCELSD